jgi:hypothetical protein
VKKQGNVRASPFFPPPTVGAVCGGVPILSYGYTHIFAGCPDLAEDAPLQAGNATPRRKIRLKTSKEISSNFLGGTTPRMPRTPENDYLPLEPIHLIDGDPTTCWSSRVLPHPEAEPVWIRIDLAGETTVTGVALRKRIPGAPRDRAPTHTGSMPLDQGAVEVGMAIPGALEVRVSCDALHWETVFAGETGDTPDKTEFRCAFPPRPAKQVWIVGRRFPRVENWHFSFSVAGAEVRDATGRNLALASLGASVTVSSTFHSAGQTREEHHRLWPVFSNLGLKWVRIGYHDDPINWHWVEKKKGKLAIDPEADAAVTHVVAQGVDVVLSLGFGNRLYTHPDPVRKLPQLWEWYYENPRPPTTPQALQGWARYVRFLCRHFRDRVKVFEVWNEWNIAVYWGAVPNLRDYLAVARTAIPIIRKECPQARVMLGSVSGFCHGIASWTAPRLGEEAAGRSLLLGAVRALAQDVDLIGWHPCYQTPPDGDAMRSYRADVEAFKAWAARQGFRGDFACTEYSYGASYPAPVQPHWWGDYTCSELQKAKLVARFSTLHSALDMGVFFCEAWGNQHYPLDLSLMRRTFGADPIAPLQPSAAYFVMRNLATALAGLRGRRFALRVEGAGQEIETCTLARPGEKVVALWQTAKPQDRCPGIPARVVVAGADLQASGFDCMNGIEQDLRVTSAHGETTVDGILVRDYPVLLRLRGKPRRQRHAKSHAPHRA